MKKPLLFLGDKMSFDLKRKHAEENGGYEEFDLVHANTVERILQFERGTFYSLGYGFDPEAARLADERHRHISEW